MTVGLPGSGLGGVFYLLSALWMPVHQLIRYVRRGERRAPAALIARQAGIAAAMIAALFATGALLGWLLQVPVPAAGEAAAGSSAAATPQVLRTALLLLTAGVLAALLLGVEVASLLLRGRARACAQLPAPVRLAPEKHAA